MITIGIDPGLSGAVAVLYGVEVVEAFDMPTYLYAPKARVKRAVDLHTLARRLRSYPKATVFVEHVASRPEQGVAGMFSLGMSYWGAAGVAAGLELHTVLIRPQEWKTHFGLGPDKEEALALARKLYPTAELSLKKHHGRAEALLIATYGKEMT